MSCTSSNKTRAAAAVDDDDNDDKVELREETCLVDADRLKMFDVANHVFTTVAGHLHDHHTQIHTHKGPFEHC